MAAQLSKSTLFSTLRSPSEKLERSLPSIPRRNYHVELGAREKALLEEDPALKKFKSYKNAVKTASKIGNVVTALALAGLLLYCISIHYGSPGNGLQLPDSFQDNDQKLIKRQYESDMLAAPNK